MLAEFCNWLIRTPASAWIQSTPWAVPAVQTVHILAIAIVLTYNLMLGLRLMGVAGRSRTYAQMAGESMPWVWGALAVLAATGLILIVGEPARELRNAAFWSKMAMLAVAIAATFTLQRRVRGNANYWDESPARRQSGKVVATVSMILWVSIAVAGRLIAYVPHG